MEFSKVIKIDLRNISSIVDFERLRVDNNIPEKYYDAETIFKLKSHVDVIFLDSITFEVFAQIPKKSKDIFMCEGYSNFLKNLKPIKFRKKSKPNKNLSIDFILDKINISGMSSLSTKENEFLKKI